MCLYLYFASGLSISLCFHPSNIRHRILKNEIMKEMTEQNERERITFPFRKYLCSSMSIRTIRPQTCITPMRDLFFQYTILSLNCIFFFFLLHSSSIFLISLFTSTYLFPMSAIYVLCTLILSVL